MFRLESGELKSEETAPYAVAIAAGSTGVGGVVNVCAAVRSQSLLLAAAVSISKEVTPTIPHAWGQNRLILGLDSSHLYK